MANAAGLLSHGKNQDFLACALIASKIDVIWSAWAFILPRAVSKGAIARNDIAQKGILIGKAIDIIGGLREGLDLENHADTLADLDNLYTYMSRRLIEANAKNDPEIIDEVARLLITIKEGWDAIGDPSAAS